MPKAAPVPAPTPAPPAPNARLALVPRETRRTNPLDGAWWPRSDDLQAECAGLVRAVEGLFTHRVVLVECDESDWGGAPERLDVGERYVDATWVAAPHQVQVTLIDGSRLLFLVVPPTATKPTAARLMQTASDPSNADLPARLLTRRPRAAAAASA